MTLILGVDAGNYMGKVVGEYGEVEYRTAICDWFSRDIYEQFGEDDVEFELNGRKGYAGTIAGYEDEFGIGSLYGETKAHEDTLVRVLLGIHRYVETYCKGVREVSIVTGQPISTHKEEEKNRIIDLLQGEHVIKVNGKDYYYHIVSVNVGIEGSSAYWSLEGGEGRMGTVRVIDVGSGTINCATIKDGRHIHASSGTYNFGTETMRNKGDYEGLARGVNRAVALLKWGRGDEVYICGGVAEEIYPYIKKAYQNVRLIIPTVQRGEGYYEVSPSYANAKGFYELGKAVYA